MPVSHPTNMFSVPTLGSGRFAHRSFRPGSRARQRGAVLIVAIVLLLLATVISVFALNVGTFEQRTSGNDMRAKLVQQVADSALSQGSEWVLANNGVLEGGVGTTWALCDAADTSFPCGAVPAAKRATMYRYNIGAVDVFGDGTVDVMDQRMLPLDRRFGSVNNSAAATTDGFAVNYGVGAVLCRLVPQNTGVGASACSTNAGENIRVNAVTLVAVADMPGENARATASRSFATNSTFPLSANTPPIVASGPIELRGNLQVVTSPNGGGPGVPVSVWSRRPLDSGGTPDTCYSDEFYRSGAPTWHPSGSPRADQILRCDDCDCGVGQLTGGQGNACTGGMDVLANPAECGTNQAVRVEEFPCDLFEHVFGVRARNDLVRNNGVAQDPNNNFCETPIAVEDPEESGEYIGTDEDYLASKADWIITSTAAGTFGERFAGDPRVITCTQANLTGKTGLLWVRTGECGDGMVIGTPTAPVLMVHDGQPSFQNIIHFGVIFVRSTFPYHSLPAAPNCATTFDTDYCISPTTGGNATFRMNAGSAVYGSVIVQGEAVKVNGTAAIIYDAKVLGNLVSGLSTPDVYGLPGSWSDAVRY